MDPTMDPAIGRVRFDAAKVAWLWTMIATGAVGVMVATPSTIAIACALHDPRARRAPPRAGRAEVTATIRQRSASA